MKLMKLGLLMVLATLVTSGCSRYHHMGAHGDGNMDYAMERATQEVKALVERTVQDPEKAKEVQGVMDEIVSNVRQSRRQDREYHQRLYALNADYNATPQDFSKILDELNDRRLQSGRTILGLRFKMKDMVSQDEWRQLTDGMAEMRNRYRPARGSQAKTKEGGY